jgi:GNAT superfamily N-acetyltransferase
MMSLTVQTISSQRMTPAQAEAVIALCSQVFNLDYRYYMALCPDRNHVLGELDGQLVAHALWLDRPMRIGGGPWRVAAYIEGVATHAEQRKAGYGAAVMRRIAQEIQPYAFGALSPAVPEWYAKLGWLRWRGPLLIEKDGVIDASTPQDEIVMLYPTRETGSVDFTASLTGAWRPFEPW